MCSSDLLFLFQRYACRASSYGELIFPGIYLNDFPTLILGAAATALFALILDTLLAALGRLLSPHLAR